MNWWGLADDLGHKMKLPYKIMRPVCDYYDISLGATKKEIIQIDYEGKAPWWL